MQKPNKSAKALLEGYIELIKTISRVEYSRLSSSTHLLEFQELTNIGSATVFTVLTTYPENCHNPGYISTAIKWAIRNELRRRYRWYSMKQPAKKEFSQEEDGGEEVGATDKGQVREAVYGTILSIDETDGTDQPIQVEDDSLNPEQKLELLELKKAIEEAMGFLSERERLILQAKFFKNKKTKEIAEEMEITSSRVSKLIQGALDKIKARLTREGIV